MSKTARQPATGYRPSGRQCAECKHAADDCSGIDFAAMPQAGRIDKDGVQRVRCMFYVRADRAPQFPATRDAGGVVTVCQRACRCGPDGCADSVACPRGVA